MSKLSDLFGLLRIKQWYKNVVIFISLIFSFNLFNSKLFFLILLGFFVLCFVSSSNYIINDIMDIEKDKYHPEKKNRPLVSGKIKKSTALFISIFLLAISLLIAYLLSALFFCSVVALVLLSQLYNLFVRNIAFLDLILISSNFVIRAISGTFIINYPVSFWVILSTFFISLFLVSEKRFAEVSLDNSKKYRPNFEEPDKKILEFLAIMSATCVFTFFSIYSILTEKPRLLFSLPIALYITLIFYRDLYKSPDKVRNPEKFIFDKKALIAIVLWLIAILLALYE